MEFYLIKELLDQSIEEKKIYSFHEYGDSSFYCGYVLCYNSDSVQIQHYTQYGEPDGTLSLEFSNVKYISIQSEYILGIEYLIENRKQFQALEENFSHPLSSASEGFTSLLQNYLNDRSIILNVEIADEHYIGFIDQINSSHFIFTEIDNAGYVIGTGLHQLGNLTAVRVNDKTGRKALFLYNKNKEK